LLQEVVLPRLGQTVEEAAIDKWCVSEGDVVKRGDILLEITTDKATLEVESFVEGTVLKIYAQAGETVPVEAVIAYVGDPDQDEAPAEPPDDLDSEAEVATASAAPQASATPASAPTARSAAAPSAKAGRLIISPRAKARAEREKVTPLAVRGTGPNGRITEKDVLAYVEQVNALRVAPAAREVAFQRNVDLLTVTGTGTSGRIMKEDVESAPPLSIGGAAAAGGRLEWTPARRVIAERMSLSKREAPHFYLQVSIDMTEAVTLREELKAAGNKVSFNDMIIKAIALGFAEVPLMNAAWSGPDEISLASSVDVSLAVSLEDGLVTPVVRGAETLDLAGIAAQSVKLIEKARNKRLTPFEYEGGTITLSKWATSCRSSTPARRRFSAWEPSATRWWPSTAGLSCAR